jgi:hypothetical protein
MPCGQAGLHNATHALPLHANPGEQGGLHPSGGMLPPLVAVVTGAAGAAGAGVISVFNTHVHCVLNSCRRPSHDSTYVTR